MVCRFSISKIWNRKKNIFYLYILSQQLTELNWSLELVWVFSASSWHVAFLLMVIKSSTSFRLSFQIVCFLWIFYRFSDFQNCLTCWGNNCEEEEIKDFDFFLDIWIVGIWFFMLTQKVLGLFGRFFFGFLFERLPRALDATGNFW